jgi:hypothetical protein
MSIGIVSVFLKPQAGHLISDVFEFEVEGSEMSRFAVSEMAFSFAA